LKIDKKDMLLYVVTNRTWLGNDSLAVQVEEILQSGATMIQLREKDIPFDSLVKEAREIRKITSRYHVPLIINDSVEVAAASDADGVHLGQGDEAIEKAREMLGHNKIIGISAHNVAEAVKAEESGADYIGAGAVFHTSTKKDADLLTLQTLKDICRAVTIPVVAIGGITKENILKLSGSGVDGVAVISAVFAQADKAKATGELLRLSQEAVREKLY
jgi:thiamine-phosphate pyrophosphorylase